MKILHALYYSYTQTLIHHASKRKSLNKWNFNVIFQVSHTKYCYKKIFNACLPVCLKGRLPWCFKAIYSLGNGLWLWFSPWNKIYLLKYQICNYYLWFFSPSIVEKWLDVSDSWKMTWCFWFMVILIMVYVHRTKRALTSMKSSIVLWVAFFFTWIAGKGLEIYGF